MQRTIEKYYYNLNQQMLRTIEKYYCNWSQQMNTIVLELQYIINQLIQHVSDLTAPE
jgi:hypothetical protein